MNNIWQKIEEIKKMLNGNKNEPEFIKSLRDYAFALLKNKKLNDKEKNLLHELAEKLETNIVKPYAMEDIIEVSSDTSAETEMSTLAFSEIEKDQQKEMFCNYIFGELTENCSVTDLLNLSLFTGGGLIIISESGENYHLSFKKEAPLGFILLILIDENVRGSITETHTDSNFNSNLGTNRIFIHENSEIKYNYYSNNENSNTISGKEIFIRGNSKLTLNAVVLEGKTANIWQVNLIGNNARCEIKTGYILEKSDLASFLVSINHLGSESASLLLFKGLLQDESSLNFRGEIYISKDADNSTATLHESTLVLSPHAQKEATPILRVENPSAKASHSSVSPQIFSKENLFYLESRGFSEKEARQALIHGFLGSIFDKDEAIQELLNLKLEKIFKK